MDQLILWSLLVAGGVIVLRFIIALIQKAVKGKAINGVVILTFIFTGASAGMAMYLAGTIKETIDEKERIEKLESAVIERLDLIREAQIVYQEVNGKYTSDWDSLINFIKNDSYPIIQRSEEIIPLDYGADSVVVHIDTIGMIPVFDRIFKANHVENSVDSGRFVEFHVQEGTKAEKRTRAYTILNRNGTNFTKDFSNSGMVTELADLKKGDPIQKGQLLISYWEYRFSPKVNLDQLAYVPGYPIEEGVKFDIYTSTITTGPTNLVVDVIEVKNPKPFDPKRDENSEFKNLKPLRFGSRNDATTSGNWE